MKKKEFKKIIDRAIKNFKRFYQEYKARNDYRGSEKNIKNENNKGNTQSEVDDHETIELKTFSTIYCISISSFFSLQIFWIFDDEINIHVCNCFMKNQFIKQRNESDMMASNDKFLFIEAWRIINITLQIFHELKEMSLLNMTYVSRFMTNAVCQDLLYVKRLFFNNEHLHLHRGKIIVATMKRFNDHYLMKDNTKIIFNLIAFIASIHVISVFDFVFVFAFVSASASKIPVKSIIAYQWHQILGHVSKNAIFNLSTSAEKMNIFDAINLKPFSLSISLINQCQSCAFVKTHRMISRLFDNAKISSNLFYRIIFDLMQLTSIYNKNEWVSHVICHGIDFNMMFSHSKKSETIKILRKTIGLIETRFKKK